MVGIVERLRQTRADMLGTPDEAHYWDCVEAAAVIEKLRAALKPFAECNPIERDDTWFAHEVRIEDFRAAYDVYKVTGND